MFNRIVPLCKKSSATPLYNLHDPWRVFIFEFMTGKSSWVYSRTQGSIPMLFCRWSNVLWLLHPLPVPRYGWWLDQGWWSLRLLFCFCGNDQTMALYQTELGCVYFQTMKLSLLMNLVCNNFKHSMFSMNVFERDVTVNGDRWTYYDLGCMYEMWFEILRDFTDYWDYMGLSWMVWLYKWSLLGLISYNLGGSVTAMVSVHRRIAAQRHRSAILDGEHPRV